MYVARSVAENRRAFFPVLLSVLFLLSAMPTVAQSTVSADVVVVVDTSTSMKQPDMDPHQTSALVTKLLTDIVPGDLAVVRLLDLGSDRNLIPSTDTGIEVPCSEDPSQRCHRVNEIGDWGADARAKRFGVLARPTRGDSGFKQQLDHHLAPVINNSEFGLAFRSAQGVFDSHGPKTADVPRMVIWLSDGNTDDAGRLGEAARELTDAGVIIQPIVFGEGKTALANGMGLTPKQVSTPASIIKAFADTFRRIVQAPYEVDNAVAEHPGFEMKPKVDEAWVVVYGDDSLGEVTIDSPEGPRPANYAQDRKQGAGAYRVFHVARPTPGTWTVRVSGGGPAAYAVIQRSALIPVLLEPRTAVVGVPISLVAGVGSAQSGNSILSPGDLPEDVTLEAEVNGQRIRLTDDGANGDTTAHDGRFSGQVTFDSIGEVPVTIFLRSTLVARSARGQVTVSGMFRAAGPPIEIDLGSFHAPGNSCREFHVYGDHRGVLPFQIVEAHSLPGGHSFEIHQSRGVFPAGGKKMPLGPGEALQLCLITTRQAPSSSANGERWLDLRLAGSESAEGLVPIHVRWNVIGLTWWQRWRWLIFGLLVLLALIIWIYGYIRPKRFSRSLTVSFVPERVEIDEQTPQPVAQWKGVGIGWYRDARAYLHPSFRLNGSGSGAVAMLLAIKGGTQVQPVNGCTIYRETIDTNWEPIPFTGRRASSGEVYRIGESGPFFRVSVRKI